MDNSFLNQELRFIHRLIWSNSNNEIRVPLDIFKRWCQGFSFSSAEPTALLQEEGGPCAIHTAVQASILRNILFERRLSLNEILVSDSMLLLLEAITSILQLVNQPKCSNDGDCFYFIAHLNPSTSHQLFSSSTPTSDALESNSANQSVINFDAFSKNGIVDLDAFFEYISFCYVPGSASHEDILGTLLSLSNTFQSAAGVICLLYSVLLTHGRESLMSDLAEEVFDPEFGMINSMDGNSSQALLNLLLTGCATPQLFDDKRDLEGYTLMGIQSRPMTGFLTLMEALQYCQVGWNLKNPRFPIWVLGSESHWTLLFSSEMALIDDNSENTGIHREGDAQKKPLSYHQGLRLWQKLDPENKGFIETNQECEQFLATVLNRKDLSSNELRDWKNKLDPENLGVVMETNVFRELFPDEYQRRELEQKKEFLLMHYNGLVRSNLQQIVRYRYGKAFIADPSKINTDSAGAFPGSTIHRCLRTKWSTLIVTWDGDGSPPSLN